MTYSDALEYLFGIPRFSKTLSLERIRYLLSALGNPQNNLKFVHIAGTNGKGSVTTIVSNILTDAGYKTGRFVSPYVEDFRERICVNGEFIEKNALAQLTEKVASLSLDMSDFPNAFEQICAIAMAYFAMCGCDIVCLEVGLGGSWDATNIIPPPEVSVITSIGLDHMQFLGDTPEKIALEKCGIIKTGTTAVISPLQPQGIIDVIINNCDLKGVNAIIPETDRLEIHNISLSGSDIHYKNRRYHISLQGEHQIYNALCAIETAYSLRNSGYRINDTNIENGLKSAFLPARMEIISQSPLCIVDGGHNAPGIDALCRSIDLLCVNKKLICVFGCLQDKSAREMAEKLAMRADSFLCVSPDSPKACTPEDIYAFASRFCNDTRTYTSLDLAAEDALRLSDADHAVLICGSLYLAGPAKKAFKNLLKRF